MLGLNFRPRTGFTSSAKGIFIFLVLLPNIQLTKIEPYPRRTEMELKKKKKIEPSPSFIRLAVSTLNKPVIHDG